jgi:2-amino-4-hydroxy-6-hydroxymethyldihydropteridine diphosphokinase
MKRIAAIALGSNLASQWGDREATLHEAIARIARLGQILSVSSFYDTAPVGYTEQPRFLNGAMLLETELGPIDLMHALLAIEREMGRERGLVAVKGPRTIDLDLLLLGNEVVAQTELTLPHPALSERRFVLEPLAEIAPAMVDPVTGHTVQQMLGRLT